MGDGYDYYGAQRGGGEAIEEAVGVAYDTEPQEDPASDHTANQTQHDVGDAAEAATAGEFAGEPACY